MNMYKTYGMHTYLKVLTNFLSSLEFGLIS